MSSDLGKLLLRLNIGVLMLLHGVSKIRGGIEPIINNVHERGLPTALAYGIYVGEVVAPILLIVGLFTRPAAVVVAINMVIAVWFVHTAQIAEMGKTGGWALELQGLYFFGALAIAFIGSGRYAISRGAGRMD